MYLHLDDVFLTLSWGSLDCIHIVNQEDGLILHSFINEEPLPFPDRPTSVLNSVTTHHDLTFWSKFLVRRLCVCDDCKCLSIYVI